MTWKGIMTLGQLSIKISPELEALCESIKAKARIMAKQAGCSVSALLHTMLLRHFRQIDQELAQSPDPAMHAASMKDYEEGKWQSVEDVIAELENSPEPPNLVPSLMEQIRLASQRFVRDNFNNPSSIDLFVIQNAMLEASNLTIQACTKWEREHGSATGLGQQGIGSLPPTDRESEDPPP